MGYRLSGHLHFCISGGKVIFLDAAADRYFALPAKADTAFQRLFLKAGPMTPSERAALGLMEDLGYLKEDLEGTEALSPCLCEVDIAHGPVREKAQVSFQLVLLALFYQLLTSVLLKTRSFLAVTNMLRRVEVQHAARRGRCATEIISAVAGAFHKTRFLLRSSDRCLTRSIGFALCCCRLGVRPAVVLGVRTNPFAAHCWVQLEGQVAYDDVGQAERFTPIMVI
ncbi:MULTISPECIES: lasso peptide biosynthesis B2 protein [unclassified Novosphingobium]|uniref:lasso peptide biosynthesis B2 protein n=1 Tax=unclassified Novosphingobium TaxID=2644732 RepID=UPI001494DCAC|nr:MULTISPECIES: lasso peptide biosynthesis B2 protein [unclassified Novosphingobium]MBB3357025.1 hypothetical protein [Novosphingobium sp. BK256]MBB3373426.1 hypothetical protein [Novosphingobium sp. BK280]MBB3377795.1 hypothetical protein [Novosphingobium sp. BK258]MBB3418794.1 hypothetical protein [Novosphingobium sp. BK267]MBB3450371.1 hypothetical protein [Novosphingobium sp. BK352]